LTASRNRWYGSNVPTRHQAVRETPRRSAAVALRGSAPSTGHLQVRPGTTFEEWRRLGAQLARISSASAWWLGDWLVYGEQAFTRRYKDAIDGTGLDYQTLRNYAWVARSFDVSRRRDKLSFQHHAEVAGLPEAQQDLWLVRAERWQWTRNELRRQLVAERGRQRKLQRHPSDESSSIELRVRVAADRGERWRHAAAAAEQDLNDWLASAADLAATGALPPGDTPPSLTAVTGEPRLEPS
jgi:hypothetical protein